MADIARREGLEFRLDRAQAVNTFTAHRLLWLTERDYGAAVQRALKVALLRTYFTGGGDVNDPKTLVKLAAASQMMAFTHDGFWLPMDTLRDKNQLEELWQRGNAPWKVWT